MEDKKKDDGNDMVDRRSFLKSSIHKHESSKIFEKLDQDGEGGIDVFELHTALVATNTLVPLDVVVQLFSDADKDADGTLSLEEFTDYMSIYGKLQKGSAAMRRLAIWKTLVRDYSFWFTSLYVWAGVLLVVPSFFTIPAPHGTNVALSVTLMYMTGTCRYLFRYPFLKWAAQVSLEDKVDTFKESLLTAATRRLEEKGTKTEEEGMIIMDSDAIYKSYVYDELFQNNGGENSANFLKSDLEAFLLADMGDVVSGPLIEYIWSAIDDNSDGIIEADEFYAFLIDNAGPPTNTERALSIVWGMVTDKTWTFSTIFLLSGSVAFFVNVLPRYGHEIRFGAISPSMFNAYLFVFGTLYFTFASFDAIRDSYDLQQSAKKMIAKWITAMDESMESARNLSSNMIINKFLSNGGLKKTELNRLLENSKIYLPKVEFNQIFKEIDDSNDGLVSRDEIEEYVNQKDESRLAAILIRCLKSPDFWAQSTWFFGSINYVVASYGYWITWNYRVSDEYHFSSFSFLDNLFWLSSSSYIMYSLVCVLECLLYSPAWSDPLHGWRSESCC